MDEQMLAGLLFFGTLALLVFLFIRKSKNAYKAIRDLFKHFRKRN
jgi:hypothetical protein